MTKRLEKAIGKIRDPYIRQFLAAADAKDSPASIYTIAALETLAERVLDLEAGAAAEKEEGQ